MAKPDKDRAERERARVYQARVQLRDAQIRRRRRDTVGAALIGGLVIAAAIGGQFAYYGAGPGAPVIDVTPSPSPSVSSDPVPGPTTTP